MSLWLLWEKVHGHVAMLAVALCFHPWFALRAARRPSYAARVSGYLATFLVAVTSGLGYFIYPAYREELKRDLFIESTAWGQAFEVKEHLAAFALAFALAGGVLMALSTRPGAVALRPSLRSAYLIAGLLGLAVGVLGVLIAWVNGFPDVVGG